MQRWFWVSDARLAAQLARYPQLCRPHPVLLFPLVSLPCCAEITATEPGRGDREASIGREVTSKAAARTPAGMASTNKSAAIPAPAETATVGDAAGSAAGIQMQARRAERDEGWQPAEGRPMLIMPCCILIV